VSTIVNNKSNTTEARIAVLEAELAELKAERGTNKQVAVAEPERGPTVTVLSVFNQLLRMPSAGELKQLHAIVAAAHPRFGMDNVSPDEFRVAFLVAGQMHRHPTNKLDRTRRLSWWTDELEIWMRQHNLHREVTGAAFTCALLGHGDIHYSTLSRWPFDFATSLLPPYFQGVPAVDAWRQILDRGRILEPETGPLGHGHPRQHRVG
jgi:hypothetical protein